MGREKEDQELLEHLPRFQFPFASDLMNRAFAQLDYGVLDLETENRELRAEKEQIQGELMELYSQINSKHDLDMKNVLKTIIGVPLESDSVGTLGATIMVRVMLILNTIMEMKDIRSVRKYVESVIPEFTISIVEPVDDTI